MNRVDVRHEAQQALGLVPGFFEQMPEPHVATMWQRFRDTQLRPGRIPAKYQQLAMLAVATHAKCKYCTDLHTELAKTFGATPDEITEIALLAGAALDLGHYLVGTQYGFEQFKREVRDACRHLTTTHPDARPTSRNLALQARPR